VRRQIQVDLAAVPRIPLADGTLSDDAPTPVPTPLPSAPDASVPAPPTDVSARAWRALAVASFGTVLVGFNSTATNIAITDIRDGFGATASQVGWGVAGYFIGTAAFLPLAGRLADRVGRKRIFQIGLVLFGVSSLLSAAAPTIWTLNAARVMQAVGGAAVLPSSLALALPLFPENRRTTAVGMWSAAGPLAAGIAPGLAALILAAGGWRMVYFVSAPISVVMFVMALRTLEEQPTPPVTSRLDILGAAAGTIAVAAIVAAVMQGGDTWGYASPVTISVSALGVAALAVFITNSARHPAPLLNLALFRRRGVWVTNLANSLISITSMSIWFVWPTFLRDMWGYSAIGVGLGVTVGPVAAGASTVVASRIGDRVGRIALCRLGAAISLLAVAWQFSRLGVEANYWLDFAPGPILYGIGWGMSTPILNSIALSSVDEEFFGETNGLFNTLRYAAAALGTGAMFALLPVTSGVGALAYYDRTLLFYVVVGLAACASLWIPMNERKVRTPR